MSKPIKVLLIEDSENDALLLLHELRRGGYDPVHRRIETAKEMESALREDNWDILICDYILPQFSAPHALALVQEMKLDLPFIIVSGNIGEENAVAAMKAGAHDYIMKDNLARLVPVIEREVQESKIRRERRQVDEALLDSEEKYRLVVENASDAIFIEQDGKIKYCNLKTLEISGYTIEELGQRSWLSLRFIPEHSVDADPASTSTYQILTKQKKEKWIDVNQVKIIYNNRPALLNFVRDITGQKALEDRLKMSQKLEAIGTLAGGIAHDFNNILSPILGYTELVMDRISKSSPDYNNLIQVYQAANRAKELVQQILTFSRQSEQEPRPMRVQLVVHEALKLLRSAIPTTIKFKITINDNCAPVTADPTQIHQIIMNLCTNAYHAMMEKGGVMGVSLDEIYINKEDVIGYNGIRSGLYVCLCVSDTGHGMDSTILPRIFEPFFTTKEKGLGTGMGLAVVHGIVKNHKGYIDVYSELGKGSTFKIYLPIEKQALTSIDKTDSGEIPRGSERILVIDDERYIAQMMMQMLESLGYTVEVKTNGSEAFDIFLQDPYYFQLVITDQIMPQITGDILARKLLAVRSDLPIILCTGFSDYIEKDWLREIGIRDVVMKPILKSEIARVIRRSLDLKKIKYHLSLSTILSVLFIEFLPTNSLCEGSMNNRIKRLLL